MMIKIQNIFLIAFSILLFTSCGDSNEGNFVLNGNVKGLKKGTLYLQKDGKRSIINLDSIVISGEPNFTLTTDIKEPVLLYLRLQKKDGKEHYIPFFADKGVTEINTTLKGFTNAKIKGSKQQELLEDYLTLMSDFNDKNLELIKGNFEAVQRKDSIASDSILKRSDRLLKLKYAATINFALNHNDSEVAPYLALYEIPNASPKFIDSIYNNLTPEIKKSLYGRRLGVAMEGLKKAKDSI